MPRGATKASPRHAAEMSRGATKACARMVATREGPIATVHGVHARRPDATRVVAESRVVPEAARVMSGTSPEVRSTQAALMIHPVEGRAPAQVIRPIEMVPGTQVRPQARSRPVASDMADIGERRPSRGVLHMAAIEARAAVHAERTRAVPGEVARVHRVGERRGRRR